MTVKDPVAGLRCTACTICEQECPPKCILIVKDTVKKPDYWANCNCTQSVRH